ncbi:MAG: hypothetical protein J1F20_06195 [Muribaculaceae bacterium]|nr:hypothetical protein [Muribaculaceae bacterium]
MERLKTSFHTSSHPYTSCEKPPNATAAQHKTCTSFANPKILLTFAIPNELQTFTRRQTER